MSRLKKYAYTLVSSYVQLGANMAFTLASVPIALYYLKPEEFGLWALCTQLSGYFYLLDMGMSGSVARILVDHKDARANSAYGEVLQTAFLVNLAQGFLVFLAGLGAVYVLGPLLKVPAHLAGEFEFLLFWQCALLAISFVFRLSSLILMAHQRGDVQNFSQAGSFVVQLGTLWVLFHCGYGLTSMIWAQGVSQVLTLLFTAVSCWKLGLLPAGNWGRPSWVRFQELFAFGRDMFLYMIGFQVVTASQMILISRLLGLEAAAIWSICTRTYTLLTQLVSRIFEMSCSPFAEMIVRREWDRLRERFKSLVVLTASLSVWTGAMFVYGNQAFMQWWTHGKIGWSPINDFLLAAYFVLAMMLRYHTGLAGLTKQFHFLRYMYLVEGTVFVTVACLVLKSWGITAMLLTSVLATLAISFPYGIFRSAQFFKTSPKTIAFEWIRPSLKLALILTGPTVLLGYACASLAPLWRLTIGAVILGAGGGVLLLRYGLDQELARDMRKRIPSNWVPGWLLQSKEKLEPVAKQ